jgi:DMSO/TMAO reductase YedYZ molybdopterin-dependent catalytic subunit
MIASVSTTQVSLENQMARRTIEPDTLHISATPEVVRYAPLNTESPESARAAPVTATAHTFIRSNFEAPQLDRATHRIVVEGAVNGPRYLSMEDLAQLPQRTVVATMECAGNDRIGMRPLPGGEPWRGGAISTTRWTGVPLHHVLDASAANGDATEVLAVGADYGTPPDATTSGAFARAIPLHVALSVDTLLVLTMNNEPLPVLHGGPVRLLVPDWYGMASVKWVARLAMLTGEYDGYFQRQRYVYENRDGTRPVRRMRVKSLIVTPGNGSFVPAGDIAVSGWAWSGEGYISGVEVSTSGDGPWYAADVTSPESPHAWCPWVVSVPIPNPGRYVLRTRARDSSGAVQPDSPSWNRFGYGNNAIQQIAISVTREIPARRHLRSSDATP